VTETTTDDVLADYDPMSRQHQQEPFDFFRAAYQRCPVHHHTLSDVDKDVISGNPLVARQTDHFYTVFPYEHVRAILSDNELFSSAQGPGPERLAALNGVGMLLYADEPHHRMQRRIINKAFTPRMVVHIEPRIREIVTGIVDGFIDDGHVEVVRNFAIAIPGTVFTEMLGVPPKDGPMFKRWADEIVAAFGGDKEVQERSVGTLGQVAQYFIAIINERREILADGGTLPDDLLTSLITSEYEGRFLDDTELFLAIHIFLAGGYETTASGLANGVYLLAEHPDQLELLRRDPSLIPNAVEEIIRLETPVQRLFRTANTDTAVAGCPIAADDKISVMYGAANRDPSVFDNPDAFDVTRDARTLRKHLGFGVGIHACVGAALARAEMRIAFEVLLERLGSWTLDPDHPPVRGGNLIVRTLAELPIRWSATTPPS
jgi:cytochrome P450